MKTTYCPWFGALVTLALLIFSQSSTAQAQGTAFSYQGQLNTSGAPANGSYDIYFTLYTTNVTGVPIAGPVTNTAVAVSNGLFSTTIDFGNVYSGQSNWLEIAVSTNEANTFITLAPRQQLNPVPYAVTAANLSGAVSLVQLPATVITNTETGVIVSGAFSGDGSGLTNLNYNSIANSPVIPSTNGFVTAGITNGFATTNYVLTRGYITSANGGNAALASNVLAGINITNVFITNSVFAGNGSGLTNLLYANIQNPPIIPSTNGFVTAGITNGLATTNYVLTRGYITSANGGNAALASNVLAGINITNVFITNSVFAGNGSGLTNLNATQLTGTVSLSRLPASVITNGASGVNISGTFSGDGSGLTNVPGALGQVIASGTNVSAQANTVYDLTNSSPVTVSLPMNANVGDIVQVEGTGPGGWQVTGDVGSNFTWKELVALDSLSIASSSDGTHLAVGTLGGGIWTNSGASWSEDTSAPDDANRNWQAIASSSDGTHLAAGDFSYDGLWISANSGVTWTQANVIDNSWESIASSSDGTHLAAVDFNGGIWTNSGANWSEDTSAPTTGWNWIASSSDGTHLAACGNGLYTSTNSGVTWSKQANAPSTAYSVASSADGTRLATVPYGGVGHPVGVYISTNSGVTWTEAASGPTSTNWGCIASSSDGTHLAVGAFPGDVWASTDSGATWTHQSGAGTGLYWSGLAFSADGSHLFAAGEGFVSEGIITLTGSQGTSEEFQYLGNSIWQPLSPSGGYVSANGTVSTLPSYVITNTETGVTLSGTFSGNGSGLAPPSNVITNTETGVILSGTLSGNGSGLTLPSNVITNTETGVVLSGTFSGNGGGLTSLNAASSLSGTIPQSNVGTTNSYTPIIGNGSANFTTTTQSGNYAKVGNLVYFEAWVVWSSKGSATSGNIVVSLPPVPVASNRAAFNVGYCSGITTAGGPPVAFASQSAANITIGYYSSSGISNVQAANCGASGELQITGTYRWQ